MLNKFCFHVHAQKLLFIGKNANGFFDILLLTLSPDIRVHRAGSQLIRHNYLDVLVCLRVVAHVHEVGVEVVADTVSRGLDLAAMVSVPFGHAAPSLSCVLFVTQGAGHQVDDEPGLTSVMSTDVVLSCRPATCVSKFTVRQSFTGDTVLVVKPIITRRTMNSRTVSIAVTTSAPHLPVFSPNHQLADIFILPRDGTDVL